MNKVAPIVLILLLALAGMQIWSSRSSGVEAGEGTVSEADLIDETTTVAPERTFVTLSPLPENRQVATTGRPRAAGQTAAQTTPDPVPEPSTDPVPPSTPDPDPPTPTVAPSPVDPPPTDPPPTDPPPTDRPPPDPTIGPEPTIAPPTTVGVTVAPQPVPLPDLVPPGLGPGNGVGAAPDR